MRKNRDELIDKTLIAWQPRTSRKLSREDAREITENVLGFFSLLLEWDAAGNTDIGIVLTDDAHQEN